MLPMYIFDLALTARMLVSVRLIIPILFGLGSITLSNSMHPVTRRGRGVRIFIT